MALVVRVAAIASCLIILLVTCSAPLRMQSGSALRGAVAPARALTPFPALDLETVRVQPTRRPSSGVVVLPSPVTLPSPSPVLDTALNAQYTSSESLPLQPVNSALSIALDAYLQQLAASNFFSGAVLVAAKGQVLLSKGYGFANYETQQAATAQTRFRLASVTKQFTAAAILLLQNDSKLRVEDPICNYLANCPLQWQTVTIHHLLTHTSGIANYTDFAIFAQIETNSMSTDEIIALFRDLPLNFPPGSAFAYGNSGYVLLGKIVEQVSGQRYADFVQSRIFAPLGMADSGYDIGDMHALNGTRGYAGVAAPALALNTSTLHAAGALYASVEDLYRWDQALYTDTLLPATARAQFFSPNLSNYAYGWKVVGLQGGRFIYHPGNISGASTFIARYPDQQVTVIVLSNIEWVNAEGIAGHLAQVVLGN
jgi:CubicO group peptidase (beta-lactamase class C family)